MRVLVLVPALYNTSPGQRYRVEQWARHLAGTGLQFTFLPFENEALHEVIYQRGHYGRKAVLMLEAFARRFRALAIARTFDTVIIYREAALIGPPLIEHLLARQGVPIIFDFDDAIWVPYISPANARLSHLKCPGKIASICRMSTQIIVGNNHLASYARQYNANVTVVPSTIDTEIYTPRKAQDNEGDRPLVIGWTGSYSTVQHLNTLRDTLRALRQRLEFRLHVIGVPNYHLDGLDTVGQEWQAESEARDLHRFDIGIMPVPNDSWSRGKCGMKLLQYMGAGVPAVASPVGVNVEIIRNGVNGFLASNAEEWIEKLSVLMLDSTLRHRMGMAGRQTVEERYSAGVWAPIVGHILQQTAALKLVPGPGAAHETT